MTLEQQQRMFDVLKRIADDYMDPDQIREETDEEDQPLDYSEYLEMAYENIQSEAAAAIRGVERPS